MKKQTEKVIKEHREIKIRREREGEREGERVEGNKVSRLLSDSLITSEWSN
jgi:hypothetical protein